MMLPESAKFCEICYTGLTLNQLRSQVRQLIKSFCLILITFLLVSCGSRMKKEDTSIRAVAGDFVRDLYQDKKVELFVFSLPGQAIVPDHSTGPRLIIFLTNLQANRLDSGDEIIANKDQVFYLTNEFSKGFVNSSHEAAYLVFGLKQGISNENTTLSCHHEGLDQLFSQGGLLVCKSNKNHSLKFDRTTLVFSPDTSQLTKYKAENLAGLRAEDIVISGF